MKIYHTKTQEDYDALMEQLKRKGCKTFDNNVWLFGEEDTCIMFDGYYIGHDVIEYFKKYHPRIPIIEYKAKQNDVESAIEIVSQNNAELFHKIIFDLEQTYLAKNKDYGNSFEQSLDEFGEVAGVARIGDKFNRAKSLMNNKPNVKNESKVDTYLDMAIYNIMQAMWLMKQEG